MFEQLIWLVPLAVAGLAEAPLFSDTAGGIMLRRFVPGRTWTREDITRPEMRARLAVLLRDVHALPPAGRRFDALNPRTADRPLPAGAITWHAGTGENDSFIDVEGTPEQINGLLTAALLANWSIDLKVEHSLADEETNETDLSLIYQAPCWSVEFATEYTP